MPNSSLNYRIQIHRDRGIEASQIVLVEAGDASIFLRRFKEGRHAATLIGAITGNELEPFEHLVGYTKDVSHVISSVQNSR